MPDRGFFQPSIIDSPPDFGGPLALSRGGPVGRDCQKVIAIGAKADFTRQARILDGGTLLPFPVNKLPDCGGASNGHRKVVPIGAEADSYFRAGMHDGGHFLPLIADKLPDFDGV